MTETANQTSAKPDLRGVAVQAFVLECLLAGLQPKIHYAILQLTSFGKEPTRGQVESLRSLFREGSKFCEMFLDNQAFSTEFPPTMPAEAEAKLPSSPES